VTAEQIVVLVLIVAAFAAGWVARGTSEDEEEAPAAGGDAQPAPARPGPDPLGDAARALAIAVAAYETAVDRWLDERDAITPAGRAAVGAVEKAVQRLDVATARLDETDHPLADAAWDALDALRDAAKRLEAFRGGAAMDAETSRALDRVDDELARSRAALREAAA
jgi:hypothetical protein